MFIDFRKRSVGERERDRQTDRHRCKRDTSTGCLPYTLTRDLTRNPDVSAAWGLNPVLQPTESPKQGAPTFLLLWKSASYQELLYAVTVRGAFEELRTVQPGGCTLTLPAAAHQGSNSSPPSATLAVVVSCATAAPAGVKWCVPVLICISLMTMMFNTLSCDYWPYVDLLQRNTSSIFVHF